MTALAILIALGPLTGPAAAIAGARARLAGIAQAAGAVVAFGCSLALLVMLNGRAPLFGWDGFLYVDSLGGFFAMTVAGVTLLAALGSIGYICAEANRPKNA
jgi:formate hydrogenlyase subunit 3/multisubunit Na+/H+ antiporter MnhD subunit